jgi:hypothetical protein
VTCCNGTYTLRDATSERAWVKEGGEEYLKPVYDSDWGWVMSDAGELSLLCCAMLCCAAVSCRVLSCARVVPVSSCVVLCCVVLCCVVSWYDFMWRDMGWTGLCVL